MLNARKQLELTNFCISRCFFLNGSGISNDTEKANLVALLGCIEARDEGGFFLRYGPIEKYLGHTAIQVFDQAVNEDLIEERRGGHGGFVLARAWIDRLEQETGTTLAEAQARYQQTRQSGARKIG